MIKYTRVYTLYSGAQIISSYTTASKAYTALDRIASGCNPRVEMHYILVGTRPSEQVPTLSL